ncbi:MAG TPA: hypothetical protein VEC12_07645, partial [Bacteroidia bacterium]|nr:hypothetical protein [Bacteroidia bacterium]
KSPETAGAVVTSNLKNENHTAKIPNPNPFRGGVEPSGNPSAPGVNGKLTGKSPETAGAVVTSNLKNENQAAESQHPNPFRGGDEPSGHPSARGIKKLSYSQQLRKQFAQARKRK